MRLSPPEFRFPGANRVFLQLLAHLRARLFINFIFDDFNNDSSDKEALLDDASILLVLRKLALATDLVHPSCPREQLFLAIHPGDKLLLKS